MNKSKIEWCDMTWNVVTGCFHECPYCYARRIATRFDGHMTTVGTTVLHDFKEPYRNEYGKIMPYPCGFEPTFHRYRLDEPKNKTKGVKIFVCSMADLFGDWVPDEWINEVMKAIANAPQHKYLFLTKNPDRYFDYFEEGAFQDIPEEIDLSHTTMFLGTTITKQEDLIKLYPRTLKSLDFLSIEPLLGEINIEEYLYDYDSYSEWYMKWIIVGAQTGPGAVKPKPEWVQNIIDQARAAKVPIFLKNNLNWPEKIQEFPAEMEGKK